MRAWALSALVAAIACSSWIHTAGAAACASICYTTDLTGFGPGGVAGCTCSGSGATRSGSGGCSCGQCYQETNGAVIGYAISSDGTCTYGTNCGDCEYSSSSSGSTTSTTSSSSSNKTTSSTSSTSKSSKSSSGTTTTAPTTDTPSTSSNASTSSGSSSIKTTSAPSPTATGSTSTTASSRSSSGNAAGEAGSTVGSNSSSGGLKTWQIALIICCGVLIFTVAVVSVLSCYCKARNRLYENEDEQADATYYEQQYPRQRQDVVGSGAGAVPTPTIFSQGPNSARSHARSGSFTNELKPMYANSAHGSNDRLVGLAPVHMRNSSGDLAGMGNAYAMDRRPSGSNRSVGRRPSLEQGYTSRDRDSLAVEL